jgi:hypothetical protein
MVYKIICNSEESFEKLENKMTELEHQGWKVSNAIAGSSGSSNSISLEVCVIMHKHDDMNTN